MVKKNMLKLSVMMTKKDKDGAQVRLWTKAKSVDYEPRQIWRIQKSDAENLSFTEAMADKALEAFKNKYYVKNSTTGYDSLGGGFWGIAEVMEAMLDAQMKQQENQFTGICFKIHIRIL